MSELSVRDGIMDRIRLRERRYDERAYLFVLAAHFAAAQGRILGSGAQTLHQGHDRPGNVRE